jgi:hypothetical protein
MAAQRIPFTKAHDDAAAEKAAEYNTKMRTDNPAWVDITFEAFREQRILEWQDREVIEVNSSKTARRAAKLEKAPKLLLDQIDALTP